MVIDSFRSGLGLSANNSGGATDGYHPLVPVLDICTVEPMRNVTVSAGEEAPASGPCRHATVKVSTSPASLVKAGAGAETSVTQHRQRHHLRHHRQHPRTSGKQVVAHQPHTARDDR